jgi:RNA polymerase sigma-70 factor (sigma-E family)
VVIQRRVVADHNHSVPETVKEGVNRDEPGPGAPRGDGNRVPTWDEDFAAFAAAARAPLARTAWLLTGSVPESEDLVQDALIQTYVAWKRAAPDNALAYARRVLVNRHIDRWRRSKREFAAWVRHGGEPESTGLAASEVTDDRDVMVRLLQNLTPRERAIVVLRHYADLSEPQVARELGISVGTVKSTTSRAFARLRSLYQGDLVDDARAALASDAEPVRRPT